MTATLLAAPVRPIDARRSIAWIACGLFVAGCLLVYPLADLFPDRTGTAYIALHLWLTGAMLAAWRWGGADRVRLILIAGILARVLLIPAPMLSSNDAERYLWDGAVALAGFDPYSVPPADPLVAGLRALWATPPEHAAYPTLYPPAALGLFALSALAGPVWGIWLWKLIASLAGIALVPVALRLLKQHGLERHFALVALSPLLVLETGVGAHLDAVVALLILCALLAFETRHYARVGALLALGACLKLLPAIALLPLVLAGGWRAAPRILAAATAVGGAVYAAALAIGWQPIGSLPVFFEKWRNGSPVFTALEAWLPADRIVPTLIVLAMILLIAVVLLARRRPVFALQLALAGPLLLSPVAFPWYLGALVPLVALAPSATLLGWLTLSPMIYEVRDRFVSDGTWMPALWPLILIAIGWAVGLIWDAASAWQRTRVQRREG